MSAYVPYRNIKQPPFDWRTATFREMQFTTPDAPHIYKQTTNAVLLAEVVRVLREGAPVELPGLPLAGATNLSAIKLGSDQLAGLVFCPEVWLDSNGRFWLSESLMMDDSSKPPRLHARWIPASPVLTEWLKSK